MPDTLKNIPKPSPRRIAVRVQPGAEAAIRSGHPWLFKDAITHQSHPGRPGDLAVVFDQSRKFLAIGLYDPVSPIRIRVLQSRQQAQINPEWFRDKLLAAFEIRQGIPADTTGFRLVNGENDYLPGFVLDQYARTLVLRLDTLAWIPHLRILTEILIAELNPVRIILRLNRRATRTPEHLYGLTNGSLVFGDPVTPPLCFQENGITFEVDPIHGQKTGFFLDQRDNRARLENLAHSKKVLNLFAYSGGFSVYAARGGAKEVVSVDLSRPAIETAQRNFSHNQADKSIKNCLHRTIIGDVFEVLQQMSAKNEKFDIVVIDPPSFAKKQAEIQGALSAYRSLTRLGLAVLRQRGVLVQASCSSRVKTDDFFDALNQAAWKVNRPLKEIERTFHALDHPVRFPEGNYLKCLFAFA